MGIFLNGWFILPNWVFYFSRYISLTQIGIVEGVAVIAGILMEVPTGALADLVGKRKSVILGSIMIIISSLILINAHEFWMFLLGNSGMFFGFSFQNGATEAFAYDSLLEQNQADKYKSVAGRYGVIVTIMTVLTTFAGGWLYARMPEYTFYAWIGFELVAIGFTLLTREPMVTEKKFSAANYVNQLVDGAKALFGQKLLPFIVPVLGLPILIKLYQGLVRQSSGMYFGYTGETFGYLLALVMIPAVVASYKFEDLVKKFKEKRLLLLTLLAYLIGFVLAYLSNNFVVGGIVFLLLMTSEKVAQPLVSLIVNEHIESRHRATVLSTLSLFTQIPYVFLVMGFAWMTESRYIPYLYLIYAIYIASVMWMTSRIRLEPVKS